MSRLFSATDLRQGWTKLSQCSHYSELKDTINDLSNISFSDISNRFLQSSIKGSRRREKIMKESNFWQSGVAWGILWQFFFELLAACGYKVNIKHLMIVKEKEKGKKKRQLKGLRAQWGRITKMGIKMAPSEKGRNTQTSLCSLGWGQGGNISFPLLYCRAEPKGSRTQHCARFQLFNVFFFKA